MHFAYKTLIAISLLFTSVVALAQVDDTNPAQTAPTVSRYTTKPGLHFLLNGGLTYGGDAIFTATYTDGSTTDIKAGSLLQFGMGGLYQFATQPLVLLVTANYHFDSISAKNGDGKFTRIPIEVLAYYTGTERYRFGGGIRFVRSPEAHITKDGYTQKYTFDSTTGLVLELGYQLESLAWLNFRAVSEKYQYKTFDDGGTVYSLVGAPAISGNHIGVNMTAVF